MSRRNRGFAGFSDDESHVSDFVTFLVLDQENDVWGWKTGVR